MALPCHCHYFGSLLLNICQHRSFFVGICDHQIENVGKASELPQVHLLDCFDNVGAIISYYCQDFWLSISYSTGIFLISSFTASPVLLQCILKHSRASLVKSSPSWRQKWKVREMTAALVREVHKSVVSEAEAAWDITFLTSFCVFSKRCGRRTLLRVFLVGHYPLPIPRREGPYRRAVYIKMGPTSTVLMSLHMLTPIWSTKCQRLEPEDNFFSPSCSWTCPKIIWNSIMLV